MTELSFYEYYGTDGDYEYFHSSNYRWYLHCLGTRNVCPDHLKEAVQALINEYASRLEETGDILIT